MSDLGFKIKIHKYNMYEHMNKVKLFFYKIYSLSWQGIKYFTFLVLGEVSTWNFINKA